MEAVAPDARVGEIARQCESLRHLRLVAMERRVEAGHLRHVRRHIAGSSESAPGCAAGAAAPAASSSASAPAQPRSSADRRGVSHPAVDDAMADAGHGRSRDQSSRPIVRISRVAASWSKPSAGQSRSATTSPCASPDSGAARRRSLRPARGTAAVSSRCGLVKRELHAGRPGVDHGDAAGHACLSLTMADRLRRRCWRRRRRRPCRR